MDKLISQQAAIEKLKRNKSLFCKNRVEFQMLSEADKSLVDEIDTCIAELLNLPSAQPDTDEWCHGCKEYDQEHHCCPRWNRVIKTTLEEAQQGRTEMSSANWIPCSERLPEDYTDVLVWFEYFRYGNYNCLYQMYGIGSYSSQYDSWLINQETGWNELKVFAWMPLPEPYKGE